MTHPRKWGSPKHSDLKRQVAKQPSGSEHKTKATPARHLALEVLAQIRKRDAYAQPLIDAQVRNADIPQEERDFAALLIQGVLACLGELDCIIDRAVTQGTRVRPKMRDAFRISVYELIFLHKESYCVVSQGVELARSIDPYAAGFANKTLRTITRFGADFPFGDPGSDLEALAHQEAFPLWLADRLVADLGWSQATEFMTASNLPAPLFVIELVQGTVHCVVPAELPVWLPRIEAGECIIADASVQEVVLRALPPALPVSPAGHVAAPTAPTGLPFLEVGSGRGTKTVLLQHNALRLHGQQMPLFALDLHAFKQDILQERIKAYRLETVTPLVGDATRLEGIVATGQLPRLFGAALIDAPCSGTGTLRRRPEIRWRLAPEKVTAMAAQGLAMLKEVACHIGPGGQVVYSTCSVLNEENEQVVEAFLASKEGDAFALEPEGQPFRPPLVPGSPDAHFAARLVRRQVP
ncbi:MAG: hypothetical protein LBL86_03875 [Coriobacteriales bacterium]|jgi:16S rRNA (cytosine967-C5)-methyltransferase|nr:hypothetical protein [Coriobacteriales bacterium]